MPGKILGALVGAIGGLVFVMVNGGQLPGFWPWVTRALGLAAFIWVLWRLRRLGALSSGTRPDSKSWRTYQLTVLLMVLAFPLGSWLLNSSGFGEYTVLWVVFVVGLHWFPFAPAFGAPVFKQLGISMVLCAVAGTLLNLLGLSWGIPAGAVAAGLSLMAYSGGLGQSTSPTAEDSSSSPVS